jgi:3',5'-nucleoside bisphosphate phosphatase
MVDIDLHLHTNYSDGTLSPLQVVKRAKDCGLNIIAITDHDGIGGVQEAREEGERLGIRVISGVEFSTEFFYAPDDLPPEGHSMHMLGYNIDLKDAVLSHKMEEILQNRKDRNQRMLFALTQKGLQISEEELTDDSPSGYVGKITFARALAGKGWAEDPYEAMKSRTLLQAPDIKSIRKSKVNAAEAIKIIHQAGGVAFLAHPFQLDYPSLFDAPQGFRQRLAAVINRLKAAGLDGLEAYYPTHDPEQTEFLLDLADRNALLVSIGSDDHGPMTRKIKKIHSFQVEADLKRLAWITELK